MKRTTIQSLIISRNGKFVRDFIFFFIFVYRFYFIDSLLPWRVKHVTRGFQPRQNLVWNHTTYLGPCRSSCFSSFTSPSSTISFFFGTHKRQFRRWNDTLSPREIMSLENPFDKMKSREEGETEREESFLEKVESRTTRFERSWEEIFARSGLKFLDSRILNSSKDDFWRLLSFRKWLWSS